MERMTKPETEEVTEKMNIVKTSLSKIEELGMERAISLEQPKYTTKQTKKQ